MLKRSQSQAMQTKDVKIASKHEISRIDRVCVAGEDDTFAIWNIKPGR